jgi:hypothetical protein
MRQEQLSPIQHLQFGGAVSLLSLCDFIMDGYDSLSINRERAKTLKHKITDKWDR